MDVWLLIITLVLLLQATANGDWACYFDSSTCGMIDDKGGGCWSRNLLPFKKNRYFYVDYNCWVGRPEQTVQTTIPRYFDPGRWQLSFSYYSTGDGFLNVTSDCDGNVPVTLDPTGRDFMEQKLDLFCSSSFQISFTAVRQSEEADIRIDSISVENDSVTTSESNTEHYRSSGGVLSSVSITMSLMTRITASLMEGNSAVRCDGPNCPVIVAVVSIMLVVVVVTMAAFCLFHRHRKGKYITRSEQYGQGKVDTIKRGDGLTDTDDDYETVAQTGKPDVKTCAKTPGYEAISKTARNHDNEDQSATKQPPDQNLRAEQAREGKPSADDLFDDKYYDILHSRKARHHLGEPRLHGDDDSSDADTSDYYSVVMPDIGGLQNSAPTRHEPLCSSDVYGEPA